MFTPQKLAYTAKNSDEAITKAKEEYSGRLDVLRGLELGQPLHNRELSEFLLATYDYDFVLGSLHNLRATEDFYFISYESAGQAHDLLNEYFAELLEIARWGMFDSLAHLTYPLRYMMGRDKINVNLSIFIQQTDEILSLLAEKGKALEINTSGLRQEIKDTLPGEYFVRRFRELGGKYITLGSDSHRMSDFGFGLPQGAELARRCGFDSLTVFRGREPYQVPFGEWTGDIWQTP
jgi:histidinol-phosphatase (PHP family)